jgi:uncharacterized protein (TIGR02118 family)
MTTLFVTYEGSAEDRFDREYYVAKHIPKVEAAWKPYGMLSASTLFPADSSRGVICVCVCTFDQEDAIAAALADPGTPAIMQDIKHFTDIAPKQMIGRAT